MWMFQIVEKCENRTKCCQLTVEYVCDKLLFINEKENNVNVLSLSNVWPKLLVRQSNAWKTKEGHGWLWMIHFLLWWFIVLPSFVLNFEWNNTLNAEYVHKAIDNVQHKYTYINMWCMWQFYAFLSKWMRNMYPIHMDGLLRSNFFMSRGRADIDLLVNKRNATIKMARISGRFIWKSKYWAFY